MRLTFLGMSLLLGFSFFACSGNSSSASTLSDEELLISVEEALQLYGNGGVVYVDTRAAESYASQHIKGSLNAVAGVTPDEIRALSGWHSFLDTQDPSKLLVAYCTCPAEATSLAFTRVALERGFRARALVGGLGAWIDSKGLLEGSAVGSVLP